MINANMKQADVYTIDKSYNDLGIEIETQTKINTIDIFISLRNSEDKMLDVYNFETANFIGITADKTVCKGNILKQNNIEYKVVEVFNLLRNTQLLLKAVL